MNEVELHPEVARMWEELSECPINSDWLDVTQDRITAFAGITMDYDREHLDPAGGRDSQFGVTVNQGFLTLSLLTFFIDSTEIIPTHKNHLNYGLNKVRWITPVPVGSRIRARFELGRIDQVDVNIYQVLFNVTIEIESNDKPAMIAEWLVRLAM